MKKTILPFAALIILGSCNNSSPSAEEQSKILVDSAKNIIIASDEFVKKGIRKEMDSPLIRAEVSSLMKSYNSIYKQLKPEDTLILYNFRIDKANELIDYIIEYNKSH